MPEDTARRLAEIRWFAERGVARSSDALFLLDMVDERDRRIDALTAERDAWKASVSCGYCQQARQQSSELNGCLEHFPIESYR